MSDFVFLQRDQNCCATCEQMNWMKSIAIM